MKAFILPSPKSDKKVQIGNKIYHTTSGQVETSPANPKGIFKTCETYVEVPMKSMEGAKLAIVLVEQRPRKREVGTTG